MNFTALKGLRSFLHFFYSGPAVGALSFLIYLRTLAPGVYGFDSAELATGAYTLGIVHPPGFPVYLILGKIFTWLPLGDVAYRLNLMSAVFAALTVFVLYTYLFELTGQRVVAWIGAALSAFSFYFWQMAIIAEVYTLHTFFLVLALLILKWWRRTGQRRFLLLFALVFGLSLTNHTSGLMFAPAYAWLIVSTTYWRWHEPRIIAQMVAIFMASLALYAYLPLRAVANPALNYAAFYNIDLTSIHGIYWMISAQAYRFFAFGYPINEIPREVVHFLSYLWRSFMGAGVLLAFPGIWWLWRQRRAELIGLIWIFTINALFYINYRVLDKDTMFLPAYLVWAVFAAAGMHILYHWVQQAIAAGYFLPSFHRLYMGLLVSLVVLAVALNWRWVDMSQSYGPALFGQEVMRRVSPGATIVAHWSPAVVLEYFQQVEHQRPDVTIYNRSRISVARFYHYWQAGEQAQDILPRLDQEDIQFVHAEIDRRPVYMVEYDPLFERDFEFVPQLQVFRLERRGALPPVE
jgi:4-amino-4-deoxy-L-arabinose transferase-like glycosyltransferase